MDKCVVNFLVLGTTSLIFLTACAQQETASVPPQEPAQSDDSGLVPDGVRKAARFAVKRVVSTPVRVAMTAGQVVEKVAEHEKEKKEEAPAVQ